MNARGNENTNHNRIDGKEHKEYGAFTGFSLCALLSLRLNQNDTKAKTGADVD
jgi:hypothetical protein